jgi:hypothetical protein
MADVGASYSMGASSMVGGGWWACWRRCILMFNKGCAGRLGEIPYLGYVF